MNDVQHNMQATTPSDNVRPSPTTPDHAGPGPTPSSVRREEHNLTTRETLQLFEAAGLPRNQRSIERYCADGKLDAFLDSDEQRYYISRASAERLIGHLLEIKARHAAVSSVGVGPAKSDGIRPATTLPRQMSDERQDVADNPRIEELEIKLATAEEEKKKLAEKNFTLQYEKKASDQIARCIRSTKRYPRRTLSIRPQPYYQALQRARQREATDAFLVEYARRAGIEGTISRGIRCTRLRRTRYVGLARVRLGHILTAVGLNVLRLSEWFLETARAKTRLTPFARLMAASAAA